MEIFGRTGGEAYAPSLCACDYMKYASPPEIVTVRAATTTRHAWTATLLLATCCQSEQPSLAPMRIACRSPVAHPRTCLSATSPAGTTLQKDQPQQAGMSTGVARAPVKDAKNRPITAGGFVDGAPVIFVDATHSSGLDKFHHKMGAPEKNVILETPGSGVALLDYDNDGWLDIYLLNGSTFAALAGQEPSPRAMLLHNNHDGTFTT